MYLSTHIQNISNDGALQNEGTMEEKHDIRRKNLSTEKNGKIFLCYCSWQSAVDHQRFLER